MRGSPASFEPLQRMYLIERLILKYVIPRFPRTLLNVFVPLLAAFPFFVIVGPYPCVQTCDFPIGMRLANPMAVGSHRTRSPAC